MNCLASYSDTRARTWRHQLLKHFNFALYARRTICIVTEPINELLDVTTMRHLSVKLTTLCLQLLGAGFDEILVVTAIGVDALRVEIENVGRHGVEEVTIVRDDEEGCGPVLEVLF